MKQQMSGWPTIIKKLKLSLMIYTHTQQYWTREMTQIKRAGIAEGRGKSIIMNSIVIG